MTAIYHVVQKKGGLGWHEYTREAFLSEEEVINMGFLDEGIKQEIEEYGGATIEGANKYTIITEAKEEKPVLCFVGIKEITKEDLKGGVIAPLNMETQ